MDNESFLWKINVEFSCLIKESDPTGADAFWLGNYYIKKFYEVFKSFLGEKKAPAPSRENKFFPSCTYTQFLRASCWYLNLATKYYN